MDLKEIEHKRLRISDNTNSFFNPPPVSPSTERAKIIPFKQDDLVVDGLF